MNMEKGIMYTKEHEWVKVEGSRAYIGITDYAQHNLGEIVYIELPCTGTRLMAGDVLCAVDSIKAASDVFSPVSGTVIRSNDALSSDPGKLNSEPYKSWITEVEIEDASETDSLMDEKQYEEFCAAES